MTLLTKQEIEALLNGGIVGQCDLRDHAGDLARTALDALARLEDTGEPALIREAEARGMERAAESLWTANDEEDWNYWGGGEFENAGRSALRGAQSAIRAAAAALRKDEEPK